MRLNDEVVREPVETEGLAADVVRVPLRSATLPPATRTNTYLLRGDGAWWVVDIGANDAAELQRLERAVEAYCGGWASVGGLLLTHAHADHVAGVPWWHEHTGLPVRASAATHAALVARPEAAFRDRTSGGAIVVFGEHETTCDGIRIVPTPGHARGHLAYMSASRQVACGDLVAGLGTIVIDPPDGEMSAYLASLDRVASLAPLGLHPAHGPSADDPSARLASYRAHRLAREERVRSALSAAQAGSARTLAEVTAAAYADVPAALHVFASRSCEAHLIRLVELGEARWVGSSVVSARI